MHPLKLSPAKTQQPSQARTSKRRGRSEPFLDPGGNSTLRGPRGSPPALNIQGKALQRDGGQGGSTPPRATGRCGLPAPKPKSPPNPNLRTKMMNQMKIFFFPLPPLEIQQEKVLGGGRRGSRELRAPRRHAAAPVINIPSPRPPRTTSEKEVLFFFQEREREKKTLSRCFSTRESGSGPCSGALKPGLGQEGGQNFARSFWALLKPVWGWVGGGGLRRPPPPLRPSLFPLAPLAACSAARSLGAGGKRAKGAPEIGGTHHAGRSAGKTWAGSPRPRPRLWGTRVCMPAQPREATPGLDGPAAGCFGLGLGRE